MSYRISTVAEITGIPRNTLIAWERRYGLLNPERQDNKYRLYSEHDVSVLMQIKNALSAGLKISEAVALVRKDKHGSETVVPRTDLWRQEPNVQALSPYDTFRAQLLKTLLAYRGEEARAMLGSLLNVPLETKLHQVIFPILGEIGQLWEEGKASVAQEHFASAIIRTHLAAQFVTAAQAPLDARHAVCTTLPHDEHEIAALALAIQLSTLGYRVSYLGARMPADELIAFVKKKRTHVLCVSCITLPSRDEFESYLECLSEVVELGVRVVLGGTKLARYAAVASQNGVEIHTAWRDFVP